MQQYALSLTDCTCAGQLPVRRKPYPFSSRWRRTNFCSHCSPVKVTSCDNLRMNTWPQCIHYHYYSFHYRIMSRLSSDTRATTKYIQFQSIYIGSTGCRPLAQWNNLVNSLQRYLRTAQQEKGALTAHVCKSSSKRCLLTWPYYNYTNKGKVYFSNSILYTAGHEVALLRYLGQTGRSPSSALLYHALPIWNTHTHTHKASNCNNFINYYRQ